jgi:hypothetical protein
MNTPAKQGVRARERNALERITAIETDLQSIVGAIQQALQGIEGKVSAQAEILEAVVQEIGAEQINSRIEAAREVRAAEHAEKSKAALEKALADGDLVPAEAIDNNTVIVGKEFDKDGKILGAGYVQLGFNTIKPEFQEKLLGQKTGFVFNTADGTFEVTGIFNVTDKGETPAEAPAVQ